MPHTELCRGKVSEAETIEKQAQDYFIFDIFL